MRLEGGRGRVNPLSWGLFGDLGGLMDASPGLSGIAPPTPGLPVCEWEPFFRDDRLNLEHNISHHRMAQLSTAQHRPAQHRAAQHRTVQYNFAEHSKAEPRTAGTKLLSTGSTPSQSTDSTVSCSTVSHSAGTAQHRTAQRSIAEHRQYSLPKHDADHWIIGSPPMVSEGGRATGEG